MAEKINEDMYDINGAHFDADKYYDKLLKECNLRQIMDHEAEIISDTQNLNSEMQTLVYENYNKFISATDTVRKMKQDFKKMEDEMELLVTNMESITQFSDKISSTLQDNRQKIAKLSGIHALLTRLQFLFKLPNQLKELIMKKQYTDAVNDYLHAKRVLQRYGALESFQGIQEDCNEILNELKQKLRNQFKNTHASAKELTESLDLLLQLDEPPDKLSTDFLASAEQRLDSQMTRLVELSEQKDFIEFVDVSVSGFLIDLTLIVTSYSHMFIERTNYNAASYSADFEVYAPVQLKNFVETNMTKFYAVVQTRFCSPNAGDTVILVRALDRLYRRLQATNSVYKDHDFASAGLKIVTNAAMNQCDHHLSSLNVLFNETLTKVRQQLAMPRSVNSDGDQSTNLNELLQTLVVNVAEKVKGVLQDLIVFIQPDISFSSKAAFREQFSVFGAREKLVIEFLKNITAKMLSFCDARKGSDPKCPPTLLLLFAKMCREFQKNTVRYLLTQTEVFYEDLHIQKLDQKWTPESIMCMSLQECAQELLNYYVRIQGLGISQMLRKSVETRDWLHTIEPRTVRAVMKRVVDDIAVIETTVGVLFEDDIRTENSSDSSRMAFGGVSKHRSNWQHPTNQMDSKMATNLHKLFSEKIEIFSSVDFSKNSILTGIIKIGLKTFLECVRLKTFSKYGLQQIQVDTHYLQLYLWRFVSDESLVTFLLDEILGSVVHRCLEPVLMEPSVVEIICERD